jgi:uncharacterized membrane protein
LFETIAWEKIMPPWEIHPALVHFPIAFFLSGVTLDLYAWWMRREDLARIATGILAAGVIMAVPTALAGLLAFFTVPAHTEAAHTRMLWHLGLEVAAVALFTAVVIVRWRDGLALPGAASRGLGLLAAAILIVASYLGGDLVYHGGAGVDPQILAPEVREGHSHSHGAEPGSAPDHSQEKSDHHHPD